MPQISYGGLFNSATLNVPDVYLNILPPSAGVVRPASIGVLGIRGVASWGPVDVATPIGNLNQLNLFGPLTVRKWDLVTASVIALQTQLALGSGAGLVLSRATDGTDTAAIGRYGLVVATAVVASGGTGYANSDTITLANGAVLTVTAQSGGAVTAASITTPAATSEPTNPVAQTASSGSGTGATFTLTYNFKLMLTSIYTGTAGNGIVATWSTGSNSKAGAASSRLTIVMPGMAPEIFDNISGTGAARYANAAAAINNGNSPQRGPSQLVIATAGTLTGAPASGDSVTLAGGTDGTGSISASNLIGSESGSGRTGIYSFRGAGCSDGLIADFDDHTQNATLIAFAQSEGVYWHTNDTAGESVTTAASTKSTDGTDSPWLKIYLGDWNYWNDNTNGQQRLLGPATFGAAMVSALQPQDAGLNKQAIGLVATQRSKANNPYSSLELSTLETSGIEVICNPIPRGSMFGLRLGRNASSDATRNLDNWPRLTSFIARSLAGPGALGPAIGQTITDDYFETWYAVLDTFLAGLKNAKPRAVIQDYQITFSRANNPQQQTALGLVVAEVLIQYLGIAQVFLVNLQTGATVVIPQPATALAA